MGRVFAIHEYVLRPGIGEREFVRAVRSAEARGLLKLPGLAGYSFVKGVKGNRAGCYAAIWIFESRLSWERLWGPPERPLQKPDYPGNWKIWEDEILAPLLACDPDTIVFTDYEEIST